MLARFLLTALALTAAACAGGPAREDRAGRTPAMDVGEFSKGAGEVRARLTRSRSGEAARVSKADKQSVSYDKRFCGVRVFIHRRYVHMPAAQVLSVKKLYGLRFKLAGFLRIRLTGKK